MMKMAVRRLLFPLLALTLAGCSAAGFDIPDLLRIATPTAVETPTVTPQQQSSALPTLATPTTDSVDAPIRLTVWLPPALDPAAGSPAAQLLRARLDAFEAETPGVEVVARVKASGGPGGLLDSLTAANAAAPDAMPSLVALTRADLEVAALKGLVRSLDDMTAPLEDADWYPYARELGQLQGATFGLPFGGDALLLLYRPARLGAATGGWETVMQFGQPVAFPAADPQGLFTLLLYQGLGGAVMDDQRRPILQQDLLMKALQFYDEGAQQGVFPYWLFNLQTDEQAWQAYTDQRAQWLVTWSSAYFDEMPADSAVAPLPLLDGEPFTLATGWVWALPDAHADLQTTTVRLAEFLVEPDFLAQWSAAAGLLPVRPSSLNGWQDESLRAALSQTAEAARLRPGNDLMASLSPALEAATLEIIKRESDPNQAAQTAVERVKAPVVK